MKNIKKTPNSKIPVNQQGSVIVSILVITIFLTTLVYGLIVLANSNLTRARDRILLLQAQYAAESGADSAVAQLNAGNDAFTGTGTDTTVLDDARYRSTYTVNVASGADAKERIVTAIGKVYAPKGSAEPRFTRKIEVIVQRSSTTTSGSMLSRNIIELHSGVKNVKAKDIYLNGYIYMHKNTTNLIAENITIADKMTGAENCSIDGDGNLVKPVSFSDPTQTRTKLRLAFNNCINPPGNSSNTDFEVLANQTNIGKVHSSFIPWNYYMDNTYQNSPGGCGDWTSGSSPRSIPSTGNTKKTHYPDTAVNISSSCGNSGDLALGSYQYDIIDHAHVRANLCAAAACTPTFYNPDASTVKFIFVEGSVNFSAVYTAAGSGPIVLASYGPDPATKASVCPLGGSIYLGNSDNTNAPDLFLLANNGLCLDKTKFGADPALGGVSGRNLYISTNPGTPFDLALDPNFPVEQVPVDLAWRAIRYRRL